MPVSISNLGSYVNPTDGKTYEVVVEVISVPDEDETDGESSAFEIELYRTECGKTLYYPEHDGSLYCAELGAALYPLLKLK